MTIYVLLLLFSFVLLYYGAEFALEQAEVIGRYFHLSPLVIGILIVGFGTSLPEFFVSQLACFREAPGIALGNVVGSNIGNIFLILGISLLIVPIGINGRDLKEQFSFHILITALLAWILTRAIFNWISSLLLILAFITYLFLTYQRMRKEQKKNQQQRDVNATISWKAPALLLVGFVLLYFGGELLVLSGKKVGAALGMSEYVLSAIVVAFGTSFPELITALIACRKKKDVNLIIGNIIGSNIFNAAFVLGSLGFYSFPIRTTFIMELSVLGAISIYFLIISFFKEKIFRFHGVLFLIVYMGIVKYWIQNS